MDRHRRGDPFLLHRRLGLARRQRLSPQSGDALPALARRRAGQGAADHLPRSRHERPDRLPLPALPGRTGGERFHRQDRGHRPRHRRQRRPPAHAGEHHSRRRKLLGILSQQRRGFPARLVPPRGAASARSSPCGCATTLPRYPATDKLGKLFPGSWIQHNFGIWIGHPECNGAWDVLYRDAAAPGLQAKRGRKARRRTDRPGLGRDVHRRGQRLVLVVRRHAHLARQDGLFDRLFRKHLQNVYTLLGEDAARRAGPPDQPGTPPSAAVYRADRAAERAESTAGGPISNGSTPGHYVCQRLARHDEHGRARG